MFGFLKGKIKIHLTRYQFSPGEDIEGTLVLELKKNIQAQQLSVQLLGTAGVTTGSGGKRYTRTETIFDFSLPLDGEKEYAAYASKSYPFKIKIPSDLKEGNAGPSMGARVGLSSEKGLTFGISTTTRRVDWRIIGRLSCSGFDVSKSVKINIT